MCGLIRRAAAGARINEYVCEYVFQAFDRATRLDKLISTSMAAVERSEGGKT
jgi:hypothetical protein